MIFRYGIKQRIHGSVRRPGETADTVPQAIRIVKRLRVAASMVHRVTGSIKRLGTAASMVHQLTGSIKMLRTTAIMAHHVTMRQVTMGKKMPRTAINMLHQAILQTAMRLKRP